MESITKLANTLGLLLTLFGAFLLYISTPTKGPSFGFWAPERAEFDRSLALALSNQRRARYGFAFICVGSAIQTVAVWLPA